MPHRIYSVPVARVYPSYIAKAEVDELAKGKSMEKILKK